MKFTINSAFSVLNKAASLNVCVGLIINGKKITYKPPNLIV